MNSTDPDFTYAPATLSYLSVLEVHIGIVVSCAMTLKPLVDHYFPGLLASSGTNSGGIMGLRAGLSSSSANNSSSLPQQQQILTVGSRPRRRNNPLRSWTTATNVDEDETAVVAAAAAAVENGDETAEGNGGGRDRGGNGGGGRRRHSGRGDRDLEDGIARQPSGAETASSLLPHDASSTSPWLGSDASSERTEDMGVEAKARSLN